MDDDESDDEEDDDSDSDDDEDDGHLEMVADGEEGQKEKGGIWTQQVLKS
jgi:hypothetical protein